MRFSKRVNFSYIQQIGYAENNKGRSCRHNNMGAACVGIKTFAMKRYLLIITLLVFSVPFAASQVKVRLFSLQSPDFVIFTVTEGQYSLEGYGGAHIVYRKNDIVVISKYNNKLAIKSRQLEGFAADSIILKAGSANSSFSLRVTTVTQFYNGDFLCYPDLETIVMINNCNVDDYLAGVVRTEGGANRHREFIKTQAIIARTYLYRHLDRHITDRYNVCDGTHCQAYHGIISDAAINLAVKETNNMVILDKDNALISSAFHSNCGGMTAASKDVWVSDLPYLRSVQDPHCVRSRNAAWEMKFTLREWVDYLQKSGYTGSASNAALFAFTQTRRLVDYKTGTFTLSFERIRSDLRLRSSFFSVIADNNSVTLRGKGYGPGVGLCQEGAMEMAAKGNSYNEIISFYYQEVIVSDLKNAK
jgi:stage II sporulation protein D